MQLQQSRWSCFAILTLNQHRASLPCQSRNAESDDGVGNDQNEPIDINKINKINKINNNANKIICHCTYQLLRALYAKIRQCWLLTCFAIFLKRSFSFDSFPSFWGCGSTKHTSKRWVVEWKWSTNSYFPKSFSFSQKWLIYSLHTFW